MEGAHNCNLEVVGRKKGIATKGILKRYKVKDIKRRLDWHQLSYDWFSRVTMGNQGILFDVHSQIFTFVSSIFLATSIGIHFLEFPRIPFHPNRPQKLCSIRSLSNTIQRGPKNQQLPQHFPSPKAFQSRCLITSSGQDSSIINDILPTQASDLVPWIINRRSRKMEYQFIISTITSAWHQTKEP